MRSIRGISGAFALLVVVGGVSVSAQTWQVTKTLPIGGEGGWDYVTVDASTHRLFVTRSTHTMVIDADSGKTLGDIPGQKRAHGVAIAPKLNRGFISDGGGSGAIIIFDLTTYATLGRLATLPDTDGIIYDPGTNLVLSSAGDSNALIIVKADVDPKNGGMDTPIVLGGAPEFLVADGKGKVYINLEDKNVVAEVDLKSRQVVNRWPVAPGGQPVGLAMDAAKHRLFIGCRNPQKLVVMNAETGKIESSVPIGAGVDATGFHKGKAFASCRDGSMTVAAEKDGAFVVEQTVKTPLGARTLGLDKDNEKIYLPTAEFEAAAGGARPAAKPGTFQIVVVGKQ